MTSNISKIFNTSAEVGQFLIPIAAGCYALYKSDYKEAALLALSAGIQKAEILFLKHLFPRLRPNSQDNKSFPSGHTAGAFLGVGLLAVKYGYSSPTVCALSGAALVALSRYVSQNHWPTDIAAGACIGLINGALAGSILSK